MQTSADFAKVYDRHAAEVVRAAREVLRDQALAEEVAQDVFLQFWRASAYDARRGPLGPYLRRLARNRAIDVWRRTRTARNTTGRVHDLALVEGQVASGGDPHAVVSLADHRAVARAAVCRLPPEQRQALALTYWGGLTVQEAAKALEIPLGTAKSRVRLALRKLAADPALGAAA